MPYKYCGRTTHYKGKTLWEIVGNLKDYGVGRVVIRQRMQRYPEPSYLRIVNVESQPCPANECWDDMRKVDVLVDEVFRGRYMGRVNLLTTSYKTDYQLLTRDQEAEFCKPVTTPPAPVLPRQAPAPPILAELLKREIVAKGGVPTAKDVLIPFVYNPAIRNKHRVAEEGEEPTVTHDMNSLGAIASPDLYEGIDFERKKRNEKQTTD